jgi:hypothetical protein
MDQAMAAVADAIPPMIFRYYQSLKDAGFTEGTALLLTVELQKNIVSPMFQPTPQQPPPQQPPPQPPRNTSSC